MAAAEHAAVIAKRFESNLIFLHVLHRDDTSAADLEIGSGAPSPEEHDAVRKRIEQLEQKVSDRPIETVVRWGDPARHIDRMTCQRNADLVMMPTHGYGPFRRFLLGSVTAKVLHDCTCPVFSGAHVPEIGGFGAAPYRKVACAIDLNRYAHTVLGWACGFARAWDAELEVIHVVKCLEQDWTQAELTRVEQEKIRELIAKVGCEAEIHMAVGDVIDYVPAAAQAAQADVLVIGRSLGEEWNGRLRTNAYALIRESPCAVISV
jgi:nucleotide-binding universal stress UspA family protein